jgi:hypothetical protein
MRQSPLVRRFTLPSLYGGPPALYRRTTSVTLVAQHLARAFVPLDARLLVYVRSYVRYLTMPGTGLGD